MESMSDRFDYGQNPSKTLGGELIRSYECDLLTADAEFLLAKAKKKKLMPCLLKDVVSML